MTTWPPLTHQDVEDDLTNGHGWAGSLIERFGIGDQLLPTPFIWQTGRYYSSAVNGVSTTALAPTANSLVLAPIYFPQARAVDQIVINVSSAGTASHLARLGIYNSSATTGMPTTVRVDAGTVAVDSTGIKTVAISTTLTGLLWLACTTQSGNLTCHATTALAVVDGAAGVTSQNSISFARASTLATSSLPNLTADATVLPSNGNVPRVMLRAA